MKRMRIGCFVMFLLMVGAVVQGKTYTQTYTANVITDCGVDSSDPDHRGGTDTTINVLSNALWLIGVGLPSDLTSASQVQSATLTVKWDCIQLPRDTQIHQFNHIWRDWANGSCWNYWLETYPWAAYEPRKSAGVLDEDRLASTIGQTGGALGDGLVGAVSNYNVKQAVINWLNGAAQYGFGIWGVANAVHDGVTEPNTETSERRYGFSAETAFPPVFTVAYTLTQDNSNSHAAGMWCFDDGSGTTVTDMSGNGHNGMLSGTDTSACWTTDHPAVSNDFNYEGNHSMTFDPTDSQLVTIPNSSELNSSSEMTIQFWYKDGCGDSTDGSGFSYIAGQKNAWFIERYRADATSDLRIKLFMMQEGFTGNWWNYAIQMSIDIPQDGSWHNLAFTYSKSNGVCKAYLDGVLKGSGSYALSLATSGYDVWIGMFQDATFRCHAFSIDEFMIFTEARTASQIAASSQLSLHPATAAPTFDPAGPAIGGETAVTISGAAGTTIYYTTDGSKPTVSGTGYSGSATVKVGDKTTLRAIAVGNDTSWITEQTYIYGRCCTSAGGAWCFDEGSGTTVTDVSGNMHNGTFVGRDMTNCWTTNHPAGSNGYDYTDNHALTFDPTVTQRVVIPSGSELNSSNSEMTIQFWYKDGCANSSDGSGYSYIAGQKNAWFIQRYRADGDTTSDIELKFFMRQADYTGTWYTYAIQQSITIPQDGNWRHIAFKYSKSNGLCNAYVDGALANSGSYSLSLGTSSCDLWIGMFQEATARRHAFSIDEFMIFLEARTDAQISASYQFSQHAVTSAPTFTPAGPVIGSETTVTISAAANTTIYYTTDGSTPTAKNTGYTGSTNVPVGNGTKLRAIAVGTDISWVTGQKYEFAQVAMPTFTPSVISGPTAVTISCATEGATIYYTLDGSTPTMASASYTAPVMVGDGKVLKAIAVSESYAQAYKQSVMNVIYPLTTETNRGKAWVKNHPFQIMAIDEAPSNLQTYKGLGFSSYMATNMQGAGYDELTFGEASKYGLGWHWFYRYGYEMSGEEFLVRLMSYMNIYPGLQGVNVGDENDSSEFSDIASIVAEVKEIAPYAVIYHSLLVDSDNTTFRNNLDDAISMMNLDVVMFDQYPFNSGSTDSDFYDNLAIVRDRALTKGVPYWNWLQGHGMNTGRQEPSESELRLQAFMSLAYGYSGLAYWTFSNCDDPYTNAILNSSGGISSIGTALAGAMNELKTLGEVTKNLTSEDVFYITATNEQQPTGTKAWAVKSGYPISSVTVASGSKGFVVGLFRADDNRKYFMVVNGNHAAYTSAAGTTASVTITFNSSLNSIQRINRSTGAKETVTLTNHALNSYSLPGGTGDLFCLTIPGDADADGDVDVADLSVLAAYYNTTGGATWAMGDFDGDKDVDVADLSILAANYNSGSSSTMSWAEAYAQAFGTTNDANSSSDASADDSEDTTSSICSSLGLSLIAGLAMLGLMIVKLEE
jgi:hypothetical protein